mmetsp:Transcript_22932/g.33846  ORF Transcript_22932/g.33846 Transcript_22932/m.33846 type:complete len:591 (+) Transcript_22932:33-1805(+)
MLRVYICLSLLSCFAYGSLDIEKYNEKKIVDATLLLESVGVDNLCHPSTDDFSPYFPKCSKKSEHSHFEWPIISSIHSNLEFGRYLTDAAPSTEATESKDVVFYIQNGLLAFLCVCTAALAAGLTLGLLSIEPLSLLIKIRTASSEEEKRQASSLLPIVRQHHMLLVTLLLLNSIANEALPLFLDKLVPSYAAIILSVTLVLFFGEIIPSAVFTGPDRIRIASNLAPLVKIVMCLLYPIAYPISRLLDIFLHDDEDSAFTRGELSALVRIQFEERMALKKQRKKERLMAAPSREQQGDSSMIVNKELNWQHECRISEREDSRVSAAARSSSLHSDEVNMIEGALGMKTKTALDIYTRMRHIFAIPFDTVLTEEKIVDIYSSGFSRVPIYTRQLDDDSDRSAVVGILLTRTLMVVNNDDSRLVSTLPLQTPVCVAPTISLIDLINLLQTPCNGNKGGHMALVCARPLLAEQCFNDGVKLSHKVGVMGLVTLEDCLEELLQEEIYDEMDRQEVAEMKIARSAFQRWRNYVIIKRDKPGILVDDNDEPAIMKVVDEAKKLHAVEQGESSPLLIHYSRGSKPSSEKKTTFFGMF